MKVIKISDLKVGSKYTKPLYLDKDSIFINANTAVSEADITRLNKFGFKEVLTQGELVQEVSASEMVLDTNTFPTNDHDFKMLQLKNIYLHIEKNETPVSKRLKTEKVDEKERSKMRKCAAKYL